MGKHLAAQIQLSCTAGHQSHKSQNICNYYLHNIPLEIVNTLALPYNQILNGPNTSTISQLKQTVPCLFSKEILNNHHLKETAYFPQFVHNQNMQLMHVLFGRPGKEETQKSQRRLTEELQDLLLVTFIVPAVYQV